MPDSARRARSVKSSCTSLTSAAACAFWMPCATTVLAADRLRFISFSALPRVIAASLLACATFALFNSTNCSVALYIDRSWVVLGGVCCTAQTKYRGMIPPGQAVFCALQHGAGRSAQTADKSVGYNAGPLRGDTRMAES